MYLEFFIHYYMYIGVNLEYFLWLGGYLKAALKGINALVSFTKKIFYHRHLIGYSRNSKDLPFSTQWKKVIHTTFSSFSSQLPKFINILQRRAKATFSWKCIGGYIIYLLCIPILGMDTIHFRKQRCCYYKLTYIYVNYAHNYEFMIFLKQKWLAATAGVFLCSCIEKSHMHFKGVGINRYLYDKS